MRRWVPLIFAGLLACQGSPTPGPEATSPSLERGRNREFVVFFQRQLVLELGGAPVAAPVTVGSLASPATMASDDPEIVAIGPEGTLVARKPGETTIRGIGTASALTVTVIERTGSAVLEKNARARSRP